MEEFVTAHDSMADKMEDIENRLKRYENKIMDMEDCSRRNNLRLRGIWEDVHQQELTAYAIEFFHSMLPDIPADMLILDRIHRVAKPAHLPPSTPRDVLMRIHYFHIKEQILKTHRTSRNVPEKFKDISIYTDLYAETLRRRRTYRNITKTLHQRNLQYRWGYPVKLLINKDGKTHVITSTAEGTDLLQSWGNAVNNIQNAGQPRGSKLQGE
ncbi:Hypothetical predicted protein [Pelobates cultripes]|uniref:Uncharacterized protein n=1 Tax=Pelobates cultripes TaxID=61616 RepID=A0AAD1RZC4_PELCU|nr:Hypothetical predicted protein [Pelobates cultripes]